MFKFIKNLFSGKNNNKVTLKPSTYLKLSLIEYYVYDFNDWVSNSYGAGNVGRLDKFRVKYLLENWMKQNNYIFSLDNEENNNNIKMLLKLIGDNWSDALGQNKKYFIECNGKTTWHTIPNLKKAKEVFKFLENKLKIKDDFDYRMGFSIRSRSGNLYILKNAKGEEVVYK